MKEVKITSTLNSKDFNNNYILLFDKNKQFVGFIEKYDIEPEMHVRLSSADYDIYESIEDLLEDYNEGTIKIISTQEMITFIENNLKDGNN